MRDLGEGVADRRIDRAARVLETGAQMETRLPRERRNGSAKGGQGYAGPAAWIETRAGAMEEQALSPRITQASWGRPSVEEHRTIKLLLGSE
jgi:hypothetical protein